MYKNSLKNILFPLVVAVGVVAGIFMGSFWNRIPDMGGNKPRVSKSTADNNKISYALSLIEKMYFEQVNIDSIAEEVLPVMFEQLDPHSMYIPARKYAEVNEALDGEFDGVGIVFNMSTDTVIVLNVIPGGPSDKAGIQNGDRIIMIGDSVVAGKRVPQNDIVKMLRGKRGTTVELSLQRNDIAALVKVSVERGEIPLKSVDASFMINDDVGFIKLLTFSKNTHAEIIKAVDALKAEGMKKLIFDLRGNTGGFMDQAIMLADDFLPADKLIVYTEDRYKRKEEEYSTGKGKYLDMELIILIDEGSASSSEVLAGAIQDNDRGLIVGRRSFGKGLVQNQIPFRDGSAIRLTVAKYFTPTGRSIQKPYANGAEDYLNDINSRYEHSEVFSADSIKFDDKLKFHTPGGKVVYGGGGIMPDIFVLLDTTQLSRYYIEVVGHNILFRYTQHYADRHRAELNGIKTVAELSSVLDKDKRLLDDFVAYASAMGVKPDYKDIEYSRELLIALLRSYIGRNTVLEDTGYYANIYPVDKTVMKAVEIFSDPERYNR